MKIADLLTESQLDEITLGDYTRKAKLKQAGAQMSKAFGHDRSPEKMAQLDREIANRSRGLDRAQVRSDKARAEWEAKRRAEHEAEIRDKYANVDIDAEIAKLQPAIQRAYHDYQYGARNTYSQAHDEYNRLRGQLRNLEQAKQILGTLNEDPTAGGTSSGNIPAVPNPKAAYSKGTKQPKNSDGTAKNALDIKGTSLFGTSTVKRR